MQPNTPFLAEEEALLDQADRDQKSEFLRFWESPTYFVVLGRSNVAETEVYLDRCADDGISVLRRPSGGGTVLQGPGCLNYTLILQTNRHPDFTQIGSTNRAIMQAHRNALAKILPDVEVKGITDLAINGLKFSGNAQKRKRNALLFHGTFLLNFDLKKIAYYLRMPSLEPEYRKGRGHLEFITNIPLSRDQIQAQIRKAWLELS